MGFRLVPISVTLNDFQGFNGVMMNPIKTEVLWCLSAHRQHQIPTGPVRIGSIFVQPVSAVRDLGVFIDADLTLKSHVTATVRACFAALQQIRSIRRSLLCDALLTDSSISS